MARSWRCLAAAARTDGPTAWRGSLVDAAPARRRLSQGPEFHCIPTPNRDDAKRMPGL